MYVCCMRNLRDILIKNTVNFYRYIISLYLKRFGKNNELCKMVSVQILLKS